MRGCLFFFFSATSHLFFLIHPSVYFIEAHGEDGVWLSRAIGGARPPPKRLIVSILWTLVGAPAVGNLPSFALWVRGDEGA